MGTSVGSARLWGGLVRLGAVAALSYLFLLSLPIATGGATWYSGRQVFAGIEGEWLFWFSLMMGGASLASAVRVFRTNRGVPIERRWTQGRALSALVVIFMAVGMVFIGPAARGAAREFHDKVIFGFPARWLGWIAIPLVLNAAAVIALVLLPRVRGRGAS